MDAVRSAAATAAVLFAGTNIDDMVVLAVLNASSRAIGRPRRWQIWAGQYAGSAVLVIVSSLPRNTLICTLSEVEPFRERKGRWQRTCW